MGGVAAAVGPRRAASYESGGLLDGWPARRKANDRLRSTGFPGLQAGRHTTRTGHCRSPGRDLSVGH